jgi:phage protein D
MGVLIIRTNQESDTVLIAEVARRFGHEVDFRFGNFCFSDNGGGRSEIVQVSEKIETSERFDRSLEQRRESERQSNPSARRFIKKIGK